ncbi:helix-turn-helix domain-containing protein [Streptomyces sp. NPDC056831]|uniref:helix-turn-helix domain-containing protein n=1 Tax=Streptomyces sp. NPDC056831 TaxID=3345954 RepID=UPI0036AC9C36
MARTAARHFLAQRYERTTVDQIVDAAEVPQRTVFRYFPAKEDLVLAPLNTSGDALVTASPGCSRWCRPYVDGRVAGRQVWWQVGSNPWCR